MTDSLISIDIDIEKIDSEIKEYQSKISEIESEINFRKQLKQYALAHKSYSHLNSLNNNLSENTAVKNSSSLNISDFVIDFIVNNAGAVAKDVIDSYAKFKSVEPEEVRNNVYNTLSRLKRTHKLKVSMYDGLSKYYINNDSSDDAAA